MAYTRGTSTNIIVGAAALFVADTTLTAGTLPAYVGSESYRETISDDDRLHKRRLHNERS
jgi:hypothetical protein